MKDRKGQSGYGRNSVRAQFDPSYQQDPLELALQRQLKTGERVLWKGKPRKRILWPAFLIWVFGIPWTACSIMWTAMAWASVDTIGADGPGWLAYAFPLFGVPFIVVGVGMMAMPFTPLFTSANTLFAVTTHRLIRMRLGRRRLDTDSVEAKLAGAVTRMERPDGSGMLRISTGMERDTDGDPRERFFGIGEVDDILAVEHAVDRMRRGGQSGPPAS